MSLSFEDLERGRGFLDYLSRNYPSIVPYLKGIHLTLDSWCPNRDEDGWKTKPATGPEWNEAEDLLHRNEGLSDEVILASLDKQEDLKEECNLYENHPDQGTIVPRLQDGLFALSIF